MVKRITGQISIILSIGSDSFIWFRIDWWTQQDKQRRKRVVKHRKAIRESRKEYG